MFTHKLILKILFFVFILSCSQMAFSQTKYTLSCARKNVKINGNFIILNSQLESKVFLIKNLSKKGVWLNRYQNKNLHASAGWNSYLKPHHWSALKLSKNKFVMSCSSISPGKIKYFNCANVIQVCESNIKTDSKQGSYWLTENKNWDDFIKSIFKNSIH